MVDRRMHAVFGQERHYLGNVLGGFYFLLLALPPKTGKVEANAM